MQRPRRQDRIGAYENSDYKRLLARLAENVRTLREQRGISQEKAAWDCGLSWSVFQRVESGKGNPTCITIAKLATGLGVDFGVLFDPPSPKP